MTVTTRDNNSWAAAAGFGTKNPNYANKQRSNNFGLDNLFFIQQKEEEEENKVNQILPFPLEHVPEQAAIAFCALDNMKMQMLEAMNSNLLKHSEKELLREEIIRIKKTKKMIKKIVLKLDTMKL